MGAEAGEGLATILRRKEWERQAGRGKFYWGIGNALGEAVQTLAARMTVPEVLFSTIRGKPRSVDVRPDGVRLWMTYLDSEGKELPLPWYAWVTSRVSTDSRQTPHYALVCKSARELRLNPDGPEIRFGQLRNLTTGRKLGFSQVTAVVENESTSDLAGSLVYPVAFRAELASPYYVRLSKGVPLAAESIATQLKMERQGRPAPWLEWVRAAKQDAWKHLAASPETTLELQLPLAI